MNPEGRPSEPSGQRLAKTRDKKHLNCSPLKIKSMKIGIIGAGTIGETLARKLSGKGHHILIANSRGPHTISFADNERIKAVEVREAAIDVDVVILTIPFGKVPELPKDLFSRLDANVPVIETMNYFSLRDGL